MPRALEIQIDVTGVDRATESVRRLAQTVRDLGGAGGRDGRDGTGGSIGERARASADRMRVAHERAQDRAASGRVREVTVSGPAQRLERARAALENAQAAGDPARIFDAEAALARATIGIQRARRQMATSGGGGFGQRLTGLLASTRLNMGGASPLVGKVAELAGLPLTGPVGAGLAAATAALVGFTAAVKTAAENLNTLAQGMQLTGGTAGQVAALGRFGIQPGAAAGFRERIAGGDPMAMMFAARLGVRALPRPFGQVNEAAIMADAAEKVMKMTNQEERLTYERELGLQSVERYARASGRVNAILDQQAKLEGTLGDAAGDANELSVATEALSKSWNTLITALGAPAIRDAATIFEAVAEKIQQIANLIPQAPNYALSAQAAVGMIPGIGPLVAPSVGRYVSMLTEAVKGNTEAHRKNTDALEGAFLPEGGYGGGPRTAKAMPSGWAGDFLNRNREADALAKGMPGS